MRRPGRPPATAAPDPPAGPGDRPAARPRLPGQPGGQHELLGLRGTTRTAARRSFSPSTAVSGLRRALLEVYGQQSGSALVAISWVGMPDQSGAGPVEDAAGTGPAPATSSRSARGDSRYRSVVFNGIYLRVQPAGPRGGQRRGGDDGPRAQRRPSCATSPPTCRELRARAGPAAGWRCTARPGSPRGAQRPGLVASAGDRGERGQRGQCHEAGRVAADQVGERGVPPGWGERDRRGDRRREHAVDPPRTPAYPSGRPPPRPAAGCARPRGPRRPVRASAIRGGPPARGAGRARRPRRAAMAGISAVRTRGDERPGQRAVADPGRAAGRRRPEPSAQAASPVP